MMTGKQKLFFLLDAIEDCREITPKGKLLGISPANDLNQRLNLIDLSLLLEKLEKDEQVLRLVSVSNISGQFQIEILPTFGAYYLMIQNEPEYQDFTGKKPPLSNEATQALRPTMFVENENKTSSEVEPKDITDEFSDKNYPFVLMVLEQILSLTEFSADDEIHYQLQSPHGQELIKERSLLQKFELRGMFRNLGEDGIFGIATLTDINTKLIKGVISCLKEKWSEVIPKEELEKTEEQNKDFSPKEIEQSNNGNDKTNLKGNELPEWDKDFRWDGKRFVFGKYGSTGYFNSKDRKTMFQELTNAKGAWVTVKKLKEITNKDDDYIRPTIGQIERDLSKELKEFISIPSTTDDNMQPKPIEGAYRIKFTPKSL